MCPSENTPTYPPVNPTVRITLALVLGLLPAAAAASPRFERLGPYGGDVRSLLVSAGDPSIVYLGTTDGSIYKSTDAGSSWSMLLPGIGRRQLVVDALVQHPSDADHIFAGAWDMRSKGGGLFETRDAGATWRELDVAASRPAIRDLAICRARPAYLIAAALDGVYVSGDGGATWRQVGASAPGFRDVESVAIDPANEKILYAGTWRLGFRSTDFGATWTRVDQGMIFDSDVFSLSIDPRNPAVVFASACSGVYRSANRAGTWKRLKLVPDRFAIRARIVTVDPIDSRRVYVGTTEGLFVSADDGETWKRLTSSVLTINAVQIDPRDPRRILIGTDDAGVMRSDDGGRTWSDSNTGFISRQISRIVADSAPARLVTGVLSDGRAGGFHSFDTSSRAWTPLTAEIVARVPEVLAFLTLERGRLAGTVQGLYWQKAGSSAWLKLQGEVGRAVIHDLRIDARGASILAATSAGIFRARAGTVEFQPVAAGMEATALAVARAPQTVVYAATRGGIARSRDGGETWEQISEALAGRTQAEALALCPAVPHHLLAGTAVGLFESSDGGATWSRCRDGRLGVDVPSVVFLDQAGKRVIAADNTFGGVFLSGDGGASWEKVEAPEYGSPVRFIAQDPSRSSVVYLGTKSEGVYRLELDEARTVPTQSTGGSK